VMKEAQVNKVSEEVEVEVEVEVENTTTATVEAPEKADTEPEKFVNATFEILDMQKETYSATVSEEGLLLQNHTKPIVLIQLFATWCNPCVGEIAYLNDLQEMHQEDLFVAGVLTRDTIDTSTLNAFTQEHHINYKIMHSESNDAFATHIAQQLDIQGTFPIPLIVIYLNGKYYTHYEGSVPVEMIKHDIKQAKKQLQNN